MCHSNEADHTQVPTQARLVDQLALRMLDTVTVLGRSPSQIRQSHVQMLCPLQLRCPQLPCPQPR